jgi:chemotaxis protein MotB
MRLRRKKELKQRHKPHDDDHIDETWLIPYADLLTLLLALFIILFASSSLDAKKFDQLSAVFNAAFNGGTGLFQKSTIVPITDTPADKSKKTIAEIAQGKQTPTQSTLQQSQQSQQQQQIAQEQQVRETVELQELKQKIDKYIEDNKLTTELKTELNDKKLIIKISDNALYASGSATLKPEAQKLAVAISNILEQYPTYEVTVSGHTDNRPIQTQEFKSNWDLSSTRAVNFMTHMLQNTALVPANFSAVGYGEFRPIATNDTEEGRSTNRRVEVSIIRNITQTPSPAN